MDTVRTVLCVVVVGSAIGMAGGDEPDATTEVRAYAESDGVVCIPAESVAGELGKWRKHTDDSFKDWVGGFFAGGCLQFTGNREHSGPPQSVLTYFVRVTDGGTYKLAVRALEAPMETGEGDKANDCYVRMVGQPEWRGELTKCVLLGPSYQWSWNVRSEWKHHTFAIAEYDLPTGVHAFQVAGRSKNFFLDRIVLYKDARKDQAERAELPPSQRVKVDVPAELLRQTGIQTGPEILDPNADLISLHYDHAPDRDDGHSAAADRTILTTLFSDAWVRKHVLAVSGAYGRNHGAFNPNSDAVMDAAWGDLGGWVAAHDRHDKAAGQNAARWMKTLKAGGDVWVKEGGQSDLTAAVIKRIKKEMQDLDTTKRIHLVQHSNWNENQTTDEDLRYVKTETDYIRITDANAYLNVKDGDEKFQAAARAHPTAGKAWAAAFAYYDPDQRLDFSDTGELLRILGLGKMDIDAIRQRFLTKDGEASDQNGGGGE
ncbi:MAG: hypothetical protein ACOC93_00620 [Planctomycetota bacterium]